MTRRKITTEQREGILGKECTKCGEWKPLDTEYNKNAKSSDGYQSQCRICRGIKSKRKLIEVVIISNNEGEYQAKECSCCSQVKPLTEYHKGHCAGEKDSRCKECYRDQRGYKKYLKRGQLVTHEGKDLKICNKCGEAKQIQEFNRNPDGFLETEARCRTCASKQRKSWYEDNKDKAFLNTHRRLARKKKLPDTLTASELFEISVNFSNQCALSGKSEKIQLDHVVPLSVGYGGTVFGNIIPLCAGLNQSKSDSNIFEWFEANRQRFNLEQSRFDRLIEWLGKANGMTVEEYRDYVYWCHANPRSIDELKAQ